MKSKLRVEAKLTFNRKVVRHIAKLKREENKLQTADLRAKASVRHSKINAYKERSQQKAKEAAVAAPASPSKANN